MRLQSPNNLPFEGGEPPLLRNFFSQTPPPIVISRISQHIPVFVLLRAGGSFSSE